VRQEDLESVHKTHSHVKFQDFLSTVSHAIYMRTDQAPFHDVRVRRAISHAVDRQSIIEAVWIRGEPTPAISRGLAEWSPRIDELGAGAKYYQHDPKEARRLLTEAGMPKGFKTQMVTTGGFGGGRLVADAAQLAQRYLKEVGIEVDNARLDLRGQRCHARWLLRVLPCAVGASGPSRWHEGIIGLGVGDEEAVDVQSGAVQQRAVSLLNAGRWDVTITSAG
jgi:peptide/nickel transport system substrate-binding protein